MLQSQIYNNNDNDNDNDIEYGYFCDPEELSYEYPGYTSPITPRSTTSKNVIVNIDYYKLNLHKDRIQANPHEPQPQPVGLYKIAQTTYRVLSDNVLYMIGHIYRDYSFIKLYNRFSGL